MHGCAGRLLNRFSSDAAIVDDALPFSANLLFANVAGLLGLALVILYTQPIIAIAFLPLAVVYRQAELSQSLSWYFSSAKLMQSCALHTFLAMLLNGYTPWASST